MLASADLIILSGFAPLSSELNSAPAGRLSRVGGHRESPARTPRPARTAKPAEPKPARHGGPTFGNKTRLRPAAGRGEEEAGGGEAAAAAVRPRPAGRGQYRANSETQPRRATQRAGGAEPRDVTGASEADAAPCTSPSVTTTLPSLHLCTFTHTDTALKEAGWRRTQGWSLVSVSLGAEAGGRLRLLLDLGTYTMTGHDSSSLPQVLLAVRRRRRGVGVVIPS